MESIATRSSSCEIVIWKREDVSICECSSHCEGKAVQRIKRITEYRHWKAASDSSLSVNREPASTSNADAQVELAHTNSTDRDNSCTIGTSSTSTSTTTALSTSDDHDPLLDQPDIEQATPDLPANDSSSGSSQSNQSQDPRDVVVWSVMEVMKLVDDTNVSEQRFVDILHFSKESYSRGLESQGGSINVSEHIDAMQWPETYRDSMKLIQEFGYQSPQKMHVCLSSSHPWLWDVTSGEKEVCRYCHERGDIPYYYLSLSDKVCLI